jgi:hypothetical protein
MRYWLGKPLLVVLLIAVCLAVFSVWYVWPGPSVAGASDRLSTPHQRQAERLIRQIERGQ